MIRSRRLLSTLALCLLLPTLGACVANPSAPAPQAAAPRMATTPRQDTALTGAVQERLRQNDSVAFMGVSVLTWNGAVLLTGAVSKPEQRRRAAALAQDVAGVTAVHNDLVLDESPTSARYLPDPQCEQRITAGLAARTELSGRYAVRVVNGVATLLGNAASSADEADRVRALVEDMEEAKWVAVH